MYPQSVLTSQDTISLATHFMVGESEDDADNAGDPFQEVSYTMKPTPPLLFSPLGHVSFTLQVLYMWQ